MILNFYKSVFDWKIRQRGDGCIAFDDGVKEVSANESNIEAA
ncbi:MAG TPA: hypothetical protein VIQ00_08135 [Chitinophagaceae bacterium]